MPLVRIDVLEGRTPKQLAAIGDGVHREEVFVNLVEVAKENWSFGNGIAQYAT